MNIYHSIVKTSKTYLQRQALSITMKSGEIRKFTYKMMLDLTEQYAKRLLKAGIVKGDRIIIITENSPEWHFAFLAILKIGATAVLIDEMLPYHLLNKCIEQADARGIYASYTVKEKLGDTTRYRIPLFNLAKNGQHFSDSYGVLSPFLSKTEDPMPDIAVILFEVKEQEEVLGVMYTHNALIEQIRIIEEENTLSYKDKFLSFLSNSHIEGLVMSALLSQFIGATLHYVEQLDYESVTNSFKFFKPTLFLASTPVLNQLKEKLSKQLDEQRVNEDYLKHCITIRKKTHMKLGNMIFKPLLTLLGGKLELIWSFGILDKEVIAFYYALGVDILHFYGYAETNIPVLGNREYDMTLNTYGRPYPGMDIKLMYPNKKKEGEMYIKSLNGMAGYFRNQEAYQKYYDEGWFKTNTQASLIKKDYINIMQQSTQELQMIKSVKGLMNKSFSAYYWFNMWKKTAQYLYPTIVKYEDRVPDDKGCILYSPLETQKGYMALVTHYSKAQFFKFGYLTDEEPEKSTKIEDEVFGKIYLSEGQLTEEVKEICIAQLRKGWLLIIKAPRDAINAPQTNEVIEMAAIAHVPIIPAYLSGEEEVKEGLPKRATLTLTYGKPIEEIEDSYTVKKNIQDQLTALIENKVEEEPLDEITQYALKILEAKSKDSSFKVLPFQSEEIAEYKELSELLKEED